MKRFLPIFIGLSVAAGASALAVAFDLFRGDSAAPPADDAQLVQWEELAPTLSEEAKAAVDRLNEAIDMMNDEEIQAAQSVIAETGGDVTDAFNGQTIALDGFLLPLDFDATVTDAFLLVPYFGACIHVPPPPPNQIVFVEYPGGYSVRELEENFYTPHRVTGVFKASATETELAETGYYLTASRIALQEE